MKLYKPAKRLAVIGNFLLICFLFGNLACHSASLASSQNVSSATAENHPLKSGAAGASSYSPAKKSALDIVGTYQLNDYRVGKEGCVNSLTVAEKSIGKISVSFEGTFVFQANGAETFHDTAASGDLTLKGNQASGRLIEEGSENGCAISLNFTGERINLKSTNCDLAVTPDGDYKRVSDQETRNENADVSDDETTTEDKDISDRTNDSADANQTPRIQYDADDQPTDIINLMEHEGEREGCGEEILTFTGKAMKVDYQGDYIYEFTLADGSRKRQKFTLVILIDDKLPVADVRSIIKVGSNLEVRYINCGNAPIATPLAIYGQ